MRKFSAGGGGFVIFSTNKQKQKNVLFMLVFDYRLLILFNGFNFSLVILIIVIFCSEGPYPFQL